MWLSAAHAASTCLTILTILTITHGAYQVVLVFERTEASVPRVLPAAARERLDDDNNDEDWDLRGTSVGGVSTPIRPKPDKF